MDKLYMNQYEFDGVFKAEVVYFLFSSPINDKRQNHRGLVLTSGLDYSGLVLVLPLSHLLSSSVVNQAK